MAKKSIGPHYVYLFEDGTIQRSKTQPTELDLQSIGDGILTVLWSDSEIMEMSEGGISSPLIECQVIEEDGQEFHA